jgi:hypothetical protein
MPMKLMITTASLLAVLAGPALAGAHAAPKRGNYASAAGTSGSDINGSRGAPERINGTNGDFERWPTDYLTNRLGDHQAQGR